MNKNILVIGSINMDLVFGMEKAPEAGESLLAKSYIQSPGGKGANQAVTVAKLGGNLTYLGRVGDDPNGHSLLQSLKNNGVKPDTTLVTKNVNSGTAVIFLEENGENRIVVSNGANNHLDISDVENILYEREQYSSVLIQLEMPISTVEFIIKRCNSLNIPVILDAGPSTKCDLEIFKNVDIISPNQTEIYHLTGQRAETLEDAKIACEKLHTAIDAKKVILKMGSLGALLYDGKEYNFYNSHKVTPVDTTAAGDSFTGALAVGYAKGWSDDEVINYANGVGALTVSKLGAQNSIPEAREVEVFLKKQVTKGVS